MYHAPTNAGFVIRVRGEKSFNTDFCQKLKKENIEDSKELEAGSPLVNLISGM